MAHYYQAVYPKFQSFNPDGSPNVNGRVYTYLSNTTTPYVTYTDASGTASNSNPVILGADGTASIWLDSSVQYRFKITDSTGTTVYDQVDNIVGLVNLADTAVTVGGDLTLTGDLNVNGYSIISTSNGNIALTPDGTGQTIIKNATLASGDLDTNGNNIIFQDSTGIVDTSSNNLIKFGVTSSAVNGFTITNSATGNNPNISATGSDTNIGITLTSKGTGKVKIGSISYPTSTGSNGQFLLTDSSGNLSFGDAATAFARNYITGLSITPGGISSDTCTQFTISPGLCVNSDSTASLSLSSSFTKTTNTWHSGSGNGGMAVAMTTNTWFHFFLIKDGSGNIDAGWDTSLTATNLLSVSGYTAYRRIASCRSNSTSTFKVVYQVNNTFIWASPPTDYNAYLSTGVGATLLTPSGVSCEAILNISSLDGETFAHYVGLSARPLIANAYFNAVGNQRVFTDTSSQIVLYSSGATVQVSTYGYVDSRGRNG